MQGKLGKVVKKRASTPKYVSPNQLTLRGFETPFEQQLSQSNRWVKLAHAIPWDRLVIYYDKLFPSKEGRPPISGRIVLGAVIIKHYLNLSDRETIEQIRENMFMQYFLGYSSFTNEEPFSPALFVEIRERLDFELMTKLNDVLALYCITREEAGAAAVNDSTLPTVSSDHDATSNGAGPNDMVVANDIENNAASTSPSPVKLPNKGRLLVDATVAPQDITFPTDLKLLNAARRKSEELIDFLYDPDLHGPIKPRTYRELARKAFLNAAKKKKKTAKQIYKANGSQLRYLRRDLKHIDRLLTAYGSAFPLNARKQKYLMVLHTVYEQQEQMHRTRTNRIADRIISIHQPHVRPIKRGKENAKAEFGSKLQVSFVNGYTFIDRLSWSSFNEGTCLMDSVKKYKDRFGCYPAEVLADQIYCSRENRKQLKLLDIRLAAKPLGRPAATAVKNHVRPGERNPVEGKFGQAKQRYGLDNIRAKLASTSESWITAIALVLNLVRMARRASVCLIQKILSAIPTRSGPPLSLAIGRQTEN